MSEDNKVQVVSQDGYGLGSETTLMVPRGNSGLPHMSFDMTEIYRIVGRTKEIERVTPATYAELITDFNVGMIQLNRLIGLIEIELNESVNNLEMTESIALLERVEDYLKSKNLKSSTDTREAAVKLDKDVQDALRRRDALKAIQSYVSGLKNSLERAYFSAKQVSDLVSRDPYLNKNAGDRKNGR